MRNQFQEKRNAVKNQEELQTYEKNITIQAELDQWLSPICAMPLNQPAKDFGSFLNMDLNDYLEILDWTGRQHRLDKPGKIPNQLAPLLDRMSIETEQWLETVKSFDRLFHRVAGRLKSIKGVAEKLGQKGLSGKTAAKEAFL